MASFGVRGDSTNKIGPWINMRQQANCDAECPLYLQSGLVQCNVDAHF